MILDRLEHANLYRHVHPRFARAFDFLSTTDLAALNTGRHEILGSDIFALAQEYSTRKPEEGFWESHRRYIDIQYVVTGTERMGHAPLLSLAVRQPYDEEKDLIVLDGSGDFCTVTAGGFAIFYPHDAHMPSMAVGTPSIVRKIVIKIAV